MIGVGSQGPGASSPRRTGSASPARSAPSPSPRASQRALATSPFLLDGRGSLFVARTITPSPDRPAGRARPASVQLLSHAVLAPPDRNGPAQCRSGASRPRAGRAAASLAAERFLEDNGNGDQKKRKNA
ncbi:MAG: hypothetical protein LBT40_14565 [Deltaproteobacteria bacterium]|nr:hypothetical protein [Deltaproteobacteria bacterium]